MNNYYIALFDAKGNEINTHLSPKWYCISKEMVIGLCIGLKYASGRKRAEARAYLLNPDGSKGELIRVQN